MKKVVLLFAMLITLSTNIFAQETVERKTLFKSKLGYEITQLIRSSGTTTFFYYSYQNQKYRHISDLGSVFISNKEELKTFAEKLIEFSNKEKGIEITYTDKAYSLALYDFASSIYIYDAKQMKYTSIDKAKAKKLAEEILTKLDLLQ